MFTNVLVPRAFIDRKKEFRPTRVERGATIGANETTVCGMTIGTYAMTLAPVIWVLISEIFPVGVRAAAITIAVVCLWLAYFILVFTFPPLFERLKENTFYIYAAICAAGFIFALFRIKETKGKNLEEVEQAITMH